MKKTIIIGALVGSLFFANEAHAAEYKVQSGDTLWKISQKFNVSVDKIKKTNQLKNNTIKSGQKLSISKTTVKKTAVASVHNVPTLSTSQTGTAIIGIGERYLGAQHVLGVSSSRTDAFDCSSFTQRVFKDMGVSLPRSSREQSNIGKTVSVSSVVAGDLLFYDTDFNGTINHVAISLGGNKIMHASSSKGTVIETSHNYWNKRIVKAKRIL